MRRHYQIGRCEDCGHTKRVTWITWWVSGTTYRVCSECIKPYRHLILHNRDVREPVGKYPHTA